MATDDLQILHPDSARVRLNSRGFVKIERVTQSTTEPATDVPWLTTTGPPTEEIYLARVTAGNLEELATALRCQRDGDTQLYEVAIRALPASSSSSVVAPTPSQTPEYSINSAEHCENDDSIDSDELLVTSLRQKLRKKKRAHKATSTSQRQQHSRSSHTISFPQPQALGSKDSPSLFFHWSHAEDQKARRQARAARIAALVLQTQWRRRSNRSRR